MDELIELAHMRSRISGENAAEELLRILFRSGIAEEVKPSEATNGNSGRTLRQTGNPFA